MNKALQRMLVREAMKMLPPRIQRALLEDAKFLSRWDVATATTINLNRNGPSFLQEWLYGAIRNAFRSRPAVIAVRDQANREWQVSVADGTSGETVALSFEGQSILLENLAALSEDRDTRSLWFERHAEEICLDRESRERWRNRLHAAPLSDTEFSELQVDLSQTPMSCLASMRSKMLGGKFLLSDMVPSATRYYERLIGPLNESHTVPEYLQRSVSPLIEELIESSTGLPLALLICSASRASDLVRGVNYEESGGFQEWLIADGDPISQLAFYEISLRDLDSSSGNSANLEKIISDFIDDDPSDEGGTFSLFSAIARVVHAELSRQSCFRGVPPFYRRQATIAQASLVIRAVRSSGLDPKSVTQCALGVDVRHGYLRDLVDLAIEPRWLPDFLSAEQLRAEFIGRAMQSAIQHEAKIQSPSLRALLVGADSRLSKAGQWPYIVYPGPLEGGESSANAAPAEILERIHSEVGTTPLSVESFKSLVNCAPIFLLPVEVSEATARSLRSAEFNIDGVLDDHIAYWLISGLAVVAACTRSSELADTVRILSRVLRRRQRISIYPVDEMRFALIAGAAHAKSEEWAKFVGSWITEIAFEACEKNAANSFLKHLHTLIEIEPRLAKHCAAAEAAADAFTR